MFSKKWIRIALASLASLATAGAVAPAGASTFGRVDLDYLVEANETIVLGEAVSAHSYWNDDYSFILTDVKFSVAQTIKGSPAEEIVVTVPGGTVDDSTILIVGAAKLSPGRSYLLFLDRVDLLGARGVLAVHDHGQGAFDVELKNGEVRAFSQALGHELAPDAAGRKTPVGGAEGIVLDRLVASVRELASGLGKNEVKR